MIFQVFFIQNITVILTHASEIQLNTDNMVMVIFLMTKFYK